MTDDWSLDARALVRPARTFKALAASHRAGDSQSTFWTAARRPLFLTLVLACVVSLVGTSVASVRLIAPTAIYWSFVPVIEILALAVVVWRRSRSGSFASLVDTFFVGHGVWTLFILVAGAAFAVASPMHWWFLITGPAIAGLLFVSAWSAYVDVCFFKYVCDSRLAGAIGSAALHRVIAWMLIFWIFAVPEPTPLGVIQEIVEAVKELLQ